MTQRRDKRKWYLLGAIFVAVFLFTFLKQESDENRMAVEAASLKKFDPGYIISDYQMGNFQSMTEKEIQAFLKKKNSCDNTDETLYKQLTAAHPKIKWHFKDGHFVCMAEELFGDGEEIGKGETAAHIIWQAAQDYKINPQVLLVLLQKESSLITDKIPNDSDYRKATGYGCPDNAPCSEKYYGFKNQVRKAAALFSEVLNGGWTNYPLGENYIQYNPSASCGGSIVNIKNLATSSLYRYTPYQPNAAALAAGYGTAECGAYGNRNFYLYFEDWFGEILKEAPVEVADEGKTDPKGETTVKERVIDDGTYQIVSVASGYAIDIENGVEKKTVSGEIDLWTQKGEFDDTTNQVFDVTYDAKTGYYSITNHLSGLALDVYGGEKADGTKVIVWKKNQGCNQYWTIEKSTNGYKIASVCTGKVLDMSVSAKKVGQRVVINTDKDKKSQEWKFEAIKEKEEFVGDYVIKTNKDSKLVLDISGGASKNMKTGDAIIYGIKTSKNSNQIFRIKKDENSDYYYIYNPTSNLYLDVANGDVADGSKVILWSYNGGCNQKWSINKNEKGYYYISSSCTGKALDVANGDIRQMSSLIIYTRHGNFNQQWLIEKI